MVARPWAEAAASEPTPTSIPRSPDPPTPTARAPPRPLRRGPPQLPHRQRTLQAVRRADHQRRLPGHPQQGEVLPRYASRRATSWSSPMRWGPRGWASRGGESGVHRRRVRRRPRLGQGWRLPAIHHRPRPVRLGRRVPGQAIRRGHEQGGRRRPDELRGGRSEPGLHPAEPAPGRSPDHPGPRRLPSGSTVQTFTGQSLKGPEGSVAILKLADTAVEYSIGDEEAGLGRRPGPGAGLRLRQGAGRRHGRGRRALGPGRRGGSADGHERPGHR